MDIIYDVPSHVTLVNSSSLEYGDQPEWIDDWKWMALNA